MPFVGKMSIKEWIEESAKLILNDFIKVLRVWPFVLMIIISFSFLSLKNKLTICTASIEMYKLVKDMFESSFQFRRSC